MKLELADIRAGYGRTTVVGADEPVRLTLEAGRFTAILGPNGSGKSTLLRVAAGLHKPTAGEARLDDRPVRTIPRRTLARDLAFVQQSPVSPPGATVRQLVSLGRHPHLAWHGRSGDDDRAAIDSAMDRCGVLEMADRAVSSLSGGERQRAGIALAVAQRPRVMLLDEPIAALDVRHQLEVLSLVRTLCDDDGTTAAVVLHDLNIAARFADRLVAMRTGRVMSDGTPDEVLTEAMVGEVFGVHASVRTDTRTGRPWCMPIEPVGSGSGD